MRDQLPCVCDICNCGKHKCPHKLQGPGPWDKCTLTEYKRQFIPHDLCPSKSLKPSFTAFLGDGPISKDTTNRVDYIPLNPETRKLYKAPDYVKPEGKIDDLTMYKKEFVPRDPCPPISIRPIPRRSVVAKFEGESTHRRDFQQWDLPKFVTHKYPPYIPSNDKFDGIGSYERDYVPHCVAPSKSCKPLSSFMQSNEPLSQDTDYRQTYKVHPIEPAISVKEKCYVQSRAPLDSLTTHKKEFTPKEICVQKSFKPLPHYIQNDKPLSDETTHRVDYKRHDTDAPFKHDPGKYIKPDVDMDLKTTYNKDFIDLPICKNNAIKPPMTKKVTAPFDKNTSYTDTFKKWDVDPVKPIKRDIFEPSTEPFEDSTTSKSAFVPHEINRVKSFKPKPHMLSTDPFDSETMYRTEYTKKLQPYCPAAFLNTNSRSVSPDGYIYHNEDKRGHLHYRKGAIQINDVANANLKTTSSILPVIKA